MPKYGGSGGKRKLAKKARAAADENEAAPETQLEEGLIQRVYRAVDQETAKG